VVNPTDRDLILGCRKQRTASWKCLLSRYERLVYSISLRYGLSRDDAADISRITFTVLIDAVHIDRPLRGSCRGSSGSGFHG